MIGIVGGNGFLGKRLSKFLLKKRIVHKTIGRKNCDLKIDFFNDNPDQFKNLNFHFDTIVNVAALTDVDYCEENKEESFKSNVLLVKKLMNFFSSFEKKPNFIHFSTDQVYWGRGFQSEGNGSYGNYYSKCKLLSEEEAKKFKSVILRTNFFGKSFSKKDSFTDWIYKNYKEKNKFYAYGNIFFNPLFVETLLENLNLIIKKPIPGIYNLGSKNGISKSEFIKNFSSNLGFELNYEEIDYKSSFSLANRPFDMRMDVSLFEETYKINLPNLEEEIKKSIKEYT